MLPFFASLLVYVSYFVFILIHFSVDIQFIVCNICIVSVFSSFFQLWDQLSTLFNYCLRKLLEDGMVCPFQIFRIHPHLLAIFIRKFCNDVSWSVVSIPNISHTMNSLKANFGNFRLWEL